MKNGARLLASILVIILMFASTTVALASTNEINNEPEAISLANGTTKLVFSGLIKQHRQSFTGIDQDGNQFTVSIEPVNSIFSASGSKVWRVYWTSVCSATFYMAVSNNKCIDAYDWSILSFNILGEWSNASLTRSSSRATLAFDYKDAIIKKRCWLRGECTGSNNEISVTYDM